jgi:hypothetical protein
VITSDRTAKRRPTAAGIGHSAHVRVSDAIDILACDVFQRADRTYQRGPDNVDGRDRRRDPNSACRCFVRRCLVHRAGGSIRNR